MQSSSGNHQSRSIGDHSALEVDELWTYIGRKENEFWIAYALDRTRRKVVDCGRKKYNPQVAGYFPSFEKEVPTSFQMYKSEEYWGRGGAGDRRIFVTKEVYDGLLEHKIKPAVWAVR